MKRAIRQSKHSEKQQGQNGRGKEIENKKRVV